MLWKDARKTLVPLAALLCALAVAAAAQEQGGGTLDERMRAKDAELQKLREEIAAERRKIEDVERKEKDIAGYLDKLVREEKLTKRLLAGIADKEELLVQQMGRIVQDLDYSEKVFDRRRVILARRLREMYKGGPQHTWQELLQANDFGDLLQRYKFLSTIAARDANLVEEVRKQKTEIARREANLTESLAQATSARREKERELARLKANEKKRTKSLAELKTSKSGHQKRIEQLARAERDLLAIIEAFEKERTASAPEAWEAAAGKDFPALKGRMNPPVEGKRVRGFGESKHPEFGTVTFNPGVDIDARAGSPVRAVARGKIEYASLLPGFGNCIIVAHGQGYYTLYAHTSKIFVKKDAMVNAGDVIAEAGGAAAGTGNAFHFEIRKSKKALDPAEWLGR